MEELHLDGNAAAGPLSEIFALEATTVMVTCAGCGHRDALGAALLYASGPGTVVRCEGCSGVLLRYARMRGQLVLDVSGMGLLTATMTST
jgi:ribosomal protein S27E